ncbi:MAG TPA: rhodanese-like domain-containing protein [Polyangiaceae bacterium]|nr:rhodanese-like domain-containing protein [Polyangiaceae bacterium]
MITKIAAFALIIGSGLFVGCRSSKDNAASSGAPAAKAETAVKEVAVAEVATFIKEKSATIFDANGEETRKEYGVVPGAVLLTSSKNFSMDVLPASKSSKLVFYCGGVMCRASDSAASRAAQAGYSDVNVMRDGIKGWKSAGQPTEMPRS